ncbi:MAG TPA: PhzF family phenazine biosynthesis protein [Actinomycetota bacterium]|nr:PhzF family phenazine biosynthesis protein [Actinomycetota bacterium]
MDFVTVSVFHAGDPFRGGNPLAVFPDAGDLDAGQMQAIAQTFNLSETTFVTGGDASSYDVRIFTPGDELPFAGHPTLGTTWVLRHLGRLTSDRVTQRSRAGETDVTVEGATLYFARTGSASPDMEKTNVRAHLEIARALRVEERDVTLEGYELGRPAVLRPALSDAGLQHFMVPLRDLDALARVDVDPPALEKLSPFGVYCFTGVGAGKLRARGLFPSVGVDEDPATGSAAACLGVYLADRLGDVELTVDQGVEMGRPSRMTVSATAAGVRVGGRCDLLWTGALERLP